MATETRDAILAEARTRIQAHGYNGMSFRDLAAAVGIKSASVHYHFPTKGDLGAALVRDYTARAQADLDLILEETQEPATCLERYVALFRKALENGNRMCLCGILAAEASDLPGAVLDEVRAFAEVNHAWLARVLALCGSDETPEALAARAQAIFAAVSGAQLIARSQQGAPTYDRIVETYREIGLLPARS